MTTTKNTLSEGIGIVLTKDEITYIEHSREIVDLGPPVVIYEWGHPKWKREDWIKSYSRGGKTIKIIGKRYINGVYMNDWIKYEDIE